MVRQKIRFLRRRMNALRPRVRKTRNAAWKLLHGSRNRIARQKPKHIIICGPARSGTTLLYNMVRHSIKGDAYAPDRETQATHSLNILARAYVTKRPLDLHEIESIQQELGEIRELFFIITVRDPLALMTSMHKEIPWQYYQSWDYGFYTKPHPSFTRPGVGDAFRQIDKILSTKRFNALVVRYEDMVVDPERIRDSIKDFTGMNLVKPFSDFWRSDVPDTLKSQLNGVRAPDEKNATRWMRPEYLSRLSRLQALYPEISERIEEYGYPPSPIENDTSFQDFTGSGTVIAMHTPDDVYKREAERLSRSLTRLNIEFSFDEIPSARELADIPEENNNYPEWFVQKLARFYKPTWLLKKREDLHGPLLYCDVDAFFHRDPWPMLGLYEGDIAVFCNRKGILNSATILINDTTGARKLLGKWKSRCDRKARVTFDAWPDVKPSPSDQPLLGDIITENLVSQEFHVQLLPPTMLFVFDLDDRSLRDSGYIEQLQASRIASHSATGRIDRANARWNRVSELESILDERG